MGQQTFDNEFLLKKILNRFDRPDLLFGRYYLRQDPISKKKEGRERKVPFRISLGPSGSSSFVCVYTVE